MSHYTLMYISKETLNSLVAYCSREKHREKENQFPDITRLERLDAFRIEVISVDRNHENFSTNDKMRDIVRKYCPMLKKINMGEELIP